VPDDLVVVVEVLAGGGGDGWSVDDLLRVRDLLVDEYVGPVVREAIARIDALLGR
jgi:hypothetical protein